MTEAFVVLVGVTGGLTEAIKRAGLSSRYAPLVSIVIGMTLTYFFIGKNVDILMQGMVASLTASGLYSGVKAVTKKSE